MCKFDILYNRLKENSSLLEDRAFVQALGAAVETPEQLSRLAGLYNDYACSLCELIRVTVDAGSQFLKN